MAGPTSTGSTGTGPTSTGCPSGGATAAVVEFARTAEPPAAAVARAAAELTRFRAAADEGADQHVVRALRAALPAHSAAGVDPSRVAWVDGTAAAAAPAAPAWVAVCAAVAALPGDPAAAARAAAVGVEIADQVARALGPAHVGAGWSVQATAGAVGAVAAAGRLLGLDAEQLRNALGVTATQAAGLAAAEGTDAGALQAGKAAGNAVEAAYLGRNGFTSAQLPLEGRRGMFALMAERADAEVSPGAGWA